MSTVNVLRPAPPDDNSASTATRRAASTKDAGDAGDAGRPPQLHNKKPLWPTRMPGDAHLRTRVVRYLRDQEGEEKTLAEIAEGTGLEEQEVHRGIDHNLFVDSLRPNLYYGVIAKREGPAVPIYRFNAVQYLQNRSRWIDARGRERKGSGKNGNEMFPDLKDIRVPNPLRWLKGRGGKKE